MSVEAVNKQATSCFFRIKANLIFSSFRTKQIAIDLELISVFSVKLTLKKSEKKERAM